MALEALICPNCNGEVELDKNQEFGFCKYCGTKIQNKNIKIVKGKIKIDKTKETDNYYIIARRALDENDFEKAERYYDLILQEEPNSYEAAFYTAYCNAYTCKIAQIENAAIKLNNCLESVFKLIKSELKKEEQLDAAKEISIKANNLFDTLYQAAKNYYDKIDYQIKDRFTQEYLNRSFACLKGFNYLGDLIFLHFKNIKELNDIACQAYENSNFIQANLLKLLKNKEVNINEIKERTEKIKKYNPNYVEPKLNTGGCYVATAVYGNYDCSEVWTLRRFRDNYLDNYLLGKIFIKFYYKVSPTLVKLFGKNKIFIKFNRYILDKLVVYLNNKGYENTKYFDKY